jgi:hypothetical protein
MKEVVQKRSRQNVGLTLKGTVVLRRKNLDQRASLKAKVELQLPNLAAMKRLPLQSKQKR